MQYMRLTKKAFQDLVNGRGDWKTNMSKIVYYSTVQNLIFYSLQSALFASLFGDDDDEDEQNMDKRKSRTINGMLDSILRGTGVGGAVVSTIKNVILQYMEQKKKWKPDHAYTLIEALNLSPPIGIKARKFYKGLEQWEWDKDVIKHMDKTDLDNPMYDSISKVIEAATNIPLNRLHRKIDNITTALEDDVKTWQRIFLFLGWSKWNLGIGDEKIANIKDEITEIKKLERKKKREEDKIKKDKELEESFLNEQADERQNDEKEITCAAPNKSGERCGMKVVGGGNYCTIHQKVEKRTDNKKVQCTKIKKDGKRCKMQTNNKSSLCYYHD